MSDTKHTPAPWSVYIGHDGQFKDQPYILSTGNHDRSSNVISIVFDAPELDANARLIAAAPELLAALNKLYSAFQHDGSTPIKTRIIHDCPDIRDALNTARAAIAKAEGV